MIRNTWALSFLRQSLAGGGGGGGGPTSDQWRIKIWETRNAGQNPALAEVQFRATSGGANQATGGTASASTTNGTSTADKAFNGNSSDWWQAGSGTAPQTLAYTSPSAVAVNEVSLQCVPGSVVEAPISVDVEYWDGSAWVCAWSFFTPATWATGETRVFTKPAHAAITAVRYLLIYAPIAVSGTAILAEEIEAHTSHGGADVTGSGTATGTPGTFSGTEGPDKAFNNNTGDWWQPATPANAIYDFGSGNAFAINELVWIPHPSFLTTRVPSTLLIRSSSDGANFIPLASYSGLTWAGTRTFSW